MSERGDWIQVWPTEDERRRAAARADEAFRAPTPERERYLRERGLAFSASLSHLRAGFLLEEAVARWLDDEGIRYERFGGVDDEPDFRIGSRDVAVKCRIGRARGDVRHTWPTRQELREEMIFGLGDRDDGSLWIMGAISAPRFLVLRGLIRRGEELAPGTTARIDNWTILTSQLRAPLGWLQDVYVAELQHA